MPRSREGSVDPRQSQTIALYEIPHNPALEHLITRKDEGFLANLGRSIGVFPGLSAL
jgi:hypothetical protein